jgi:hypothetical protein
MPVEIIGEAGTSGASREWIDAECQLAIKHLIKVCGELPPEMELEVQWQEHDLGEYPTIVLMWEDAMRGAPWDYIEKCGEALTEYEHQ